MFLEKLEVGIYKVNCYVIADEKKMKAAVIDPGGDFDKIKELLDTNGFELDFIILTHAHGDHIGAITDLKQNYNSKIIAHFMENELLENSEFNYSSKLGMNSITTSVDKLVHDGDDIYLGDIKITVIHTPGHTKGSICLIVNDVILSGDTLVAGSMGRTDLYSGDLNEMKNSLNKLKKLTKNYTILPGHGQSTTLDYEKTYNPFMRDDFNEY